MLWRESTKMPEFFGDHSNLLETKETILSLTEVLTEVLKPATLGSSVTGLHCVHYKQQEVSITVISFFIHIFFFVIIILFLLNVPSKTSLQQLNSSKRKDQFSASVNKARQLHSVTWSAMFFFFEKKENCN